MKIALITDTHLGCRSDSNFFIQHMLEFYEEQFFPYLEHNEIDTIIHLGDFFDKRKSINFVTLKNAQSIFRKFNRYNTHLILGNHDITHKNTNETDSPSLLLENYKNIRIYKDTQEIDFDNCNVLFIPWINSENEEKSLSLIKRSKADVAMGHLAVKGFEILTGVVSNEGLDPELFKQFINVYSGHFHKKSSSGNIHYLGSPFKITWADYSNSNGFYIFDTETKDVEFIENERTLFRKVVYDSTTDYYRVDVKDKYIKLIVEDKNAINSNKFEKVVQILTEKNPIELTVVEDDNLDEVLEEQRIDETKDTLTMLQDYVKDIEINCDLNELNNLFTELYKEANDAL
jgi:predicted phosphodiesterase